MTEDARFEDGGEAPLRLMAVDAEDLQVVSALTQDAVFPANEIGWYPAERRFAILINRFRWEDLDAAQKRGRQVERVQSVLMFQCVMNVQSQDVPQRDADTVLSILSIDWKAGEDGAGSILLNLAGDGVIKLDVEAIEIMLKDVTRPYIAPSHQAPSHPE
ncbi:DUF2948 family protein [Marivivens aquimaris]|uniref:DUF2948 family protein n=1 Tax=Marivivens aquimaris TaxID=2774876 RepID=UPI00187F3BA7|nr:DUF2948 family protein [Marivivens aquimaris]